MTISNIPYSLSASDLETLRNELDLILNSIADRLDALEGARGYGVIKNRMDVVDDNGNRIHGITNESL